jgi:hypothetical protein
VGPWVPWGADVHVLEFSYSGRLYVLQERTAGLIVQMPAAALCCVHCNVLLSVFLLMVACCCCLLLTGVWGNRGRL